MGKAEEKIKKDRAKLLKLVENDQAREPKYLGPWFRVLSDSLHSKKHISNVDHGTYTQTEYNKGVVAKRVAALEEQGYQNVWVREIPKEDEPEEVYPE